MITFGSNANSNCTTDETFHVCFNEINCYKYVMFCKSNNKLMMDVFIFDLTTAFVQF